MSLYENPLALDDDVARVGMAPAEGTASPGTVTTGATTGLPAEGSAILIGHTAGKRPREEGAAVETAREGTVENLEVGAAPSSAHARPATADVESRGDNVNPNSGLMERGDNKLVELETRDEEAYEVDETDPALAGCGEDPEADSLSSLLLRLAELRATSKSRTVHHTFAMRTATEEAKALEHFTDAQRRYQKDLADQHIRQTRLCEASAHGRGFAKVTSVKTGEGRSGVAHSAAGAAAAVQLVSSARRAKSLRERVVMLRQHLEESSRTHTAPALPHTITGAQTLYASAGMAYHDTVTLSSAAIDFPTGVAAPDREATHAALTAAIQYVSDPIRQEAIKSLSDAVRSLRQHNSSLVAYADGLTRRMHAIEDALACLQLPAQEWGLLLAQQAMASRLQQVCSPAFLQEEAALARNRQLHQQLAERKWVLTVLLAATNSDATPPLGEHVLPANWAQQTDASKEHIQRQESLRNALVQEAFLLRQRMPLARGSNLLSLELKPSNSCQPALAATHSVGRRLAEQQYTLLASLVQRLLHPLAQPTPAEGVKQAEKDGTSPRPATHLSTLEESVASRQHTLAALVAYNARLGQDVKAVLNLSAVAVDRAAAKQLAEAFLQRCGYVQGGEEGEESAMPVAGPSSLPAAEDAVLTQYRQRLDHLQREATVFLEALHNRCDAAERQIRLEVALLLSLLCITDQNDLAAMRGAAEQELEAPSAAVLIPALRQLGTVTETAAVEVLLPTLPAEGSGVRDVFSAMAQSKYTTVLPTWQSLWESADAKQRELSWYTQHETDDVPKQLEEIQIQKTSLLRATAEADTASRAMTQEKQLVATLHKAQQSLSSTRIPELEQRLQQLQSEVASLRAEQCRRQQHAELEAAAAEAERQLKEDAARRQQQEEAAARAPPQFQGEPQGLLQGQTPQVERVQDAVSADSTVPAAVLAPIDLAEPTFAPIPEEETGETPASLQVAGTELDEPILLNDVNDVAKDDSNSTLTGAPTVQEGNELPPVFDKIFTSGFY